MVPRYTVIMIFLCLFSCLEKVTGQEVPLDERFYIAVEEQRGAGTEGGGSSTPFALDDVEKITLSGTISSEEDMAIDIDIRVPNPTAPGGMEGKGKILLEHPGEFSLEVPKNLKRSMSVASKPKKCLKKLNENDIPISL